MVLSALRSYGESNATVAEKGLWALGNLSIDDVNRAEFSEGGACAGASAAASFVYATVFICSCACVCVCMR